MNRVGFPSRWLLLMTAALCWNLAAGQIRNESAANPEFVTATNRFGFTLLRQLWKQEPDRNIFFSPLSMTQALSMAYNGAAGGTQREMRRALGFEQLTLDELNRSSAAFLKEFARKDASLQLTIANSLWTRQGVKFNPDFLARNQKFYKADISALDFDNPGSVAVINDWVGRRTNGKIPAIIDKLEPDDVLVLINAVYFKGPWAFPFHPAQTSNDVFYLPGRVRAQVPMMSQRESLPCYDGDSVRAVTLPYASFGAQMALFLPDEGVSITELLRKFDYDSYLHSRPLFQAGSVTLKLPRVKLQYATDLTPPLQALGMRAAFTHAADFSGMTSAEKLLMSKVSHKASLQIDETGTEASAATGITARLTSAPPPFVFIANRPFIVLITDVESNAILFMGVVTNPQPDATRG